MSSEKQIDREAVTPTNAALMSATSINASSAKVDAQIVRRVSGQTSAQEQSNLSRRRSGALVMSMIAIGSMLFRRLNYDSMTAMISEVLICGSLVAAIAWLRSRDAKKNRAGKVDTSRPASARNVELAQSRSPWVTPLIIAILLAPWLIDRASRGMGGGNGIEIVMLSNLAWSSLIAAVVASAMRTVSISVICSGFLTLFATFISDSGQATWFAYLWGILCLWWLVSNHWESVECLSATQTQASSSYRFVAALCGCLVFFVISATLADRIPVLRKIKAEVMPTSGGTTGKDSVGRGIGNGDALVAAKNHPSSFGAVETDIFLESSKQSLFDVVGEEMGSAKRNKRVERTQALDSQQIQAQAGNFSEANQATGGSEFSTDRNSPKLREKPDNIVKESIMFWSGCSSAHLAVDRFRYFDGVQWHNQASGPQSFAPAEKAPLTLSVDEKNWFYTTAAAFPNDNSPYVDAISESLKFTRFRSPVIPTRQGLQMWSIDMLDQADFFSVDGNGVISMPGRLHVPDYTVIRMINSRVDAGRVEAMLEAIEPRAFAWPAEADFRDDLDRLAQDWSEGQPRSWDQVERIVNRLRTEFKFDRQWRPDDSKDETPLKQFIESRQGPSYLFATLAAQVLGRLGYETRFVSGFYTNPQHFLRSQQETAILPQDAHVWIEIHLGGGQWMSLEPTPGYLAEPLYAGWWYQIKKARYAIAATILVLTITSILAYVLRGVLVEAICQLLWPLVTLLPDRSRVAWLAKLIDVRTQLAGAPRSKSRVLREHLKSLSAALPQELIQAYEQFCQASDRICFGGTTRLTSNDKAAMRQLWRRMTYFRFRAHRRKTAIHT